MLSILYEQVEIERKRLHEIVTQNGINSREALAQSKFIDNIFNLINRPQATPNGTAVKPHRH